MRKERKVRKWDRGNVKGERELIRDEESNRKIKKGRKYRRRREEEGMRRKKGAQ